MANFKEGVRVDRISTPMLTAILIVDAIHKGFTEHEVTVTSVTDGKHSENSLHYHGNAVDFRTWAVKSHKAEHQFVLHVRRALEPFYDVVRESTHLHVEFDPKKGENRQ